MPKESFCLRIHRTHGEKTIDAANKIGLTDKTLIIQKEGDRLCIPLLREPNAEEVFKLDAQVSDLQISKQLFSVKNQKERTLPQALAETLPAHLQVSLPRALDVIGDIAIVEIPPELKAYKKTIAEAVLETHKNIRVVLGKAGKVSGTYRLRQFEFIGGEHRTLTLYKENGCSYYVDVAKAYFSPRLSHERQRVALLVKDGELVVDLFSGVGPFAIPIAKKWKKVKVYAIDINSDAIDLLKRNVALNRVDNRVCPIVGDARQVAYERLAGEASRVIMNLPESAFNFVDVACKAAKPGAMVHFYAFMRSPETLEDVKKRFELSVQNSGRKVEMFECAKLVRETAPYEWQVVLDAKII